MTRSFAVRLLLLDFDYILLGDAGDRSFALGPWRIVSACSVAGRVPCSSGCTGRGRTAFDASH